MVYCIVRTGSVGAGGLHHPHPLPAAHLPQPGGQPPMPRARAGIHPTDGGCTNHTIIGACFLDAKHLYISHPVSVYVVSVVKVIFFKYNEG